jgi:hypothetical protein
VAGKAGGGAPTVDTSMNCPACGFVNTAAARFCGGCRRAVACAPAHDALAVEPRALTSLLDPRRVYPAADDDPAERRLAVGRMACDANGRELVDAHEALAEAS